jgi:hypothetical protein
MSGSSSEVPPGIHWAVGYGTHLLPYNGYIVHVHIYIYGRCNGIWWSISKSWTSHLLDRAWVKISELANVSISKLRLYPHIWLCLNTGVSLAQWFVIIMYHNPYFHTRPFSNMIPCQMPALRWISLDTDCGFSNEQLLCDLCGRCMGFWKKL